MHQPDRGEVTLEGQNLARLPEPRLAGVRAATIGFVFQTFNLIPTLSAQENVEAALVPRHLADAQRRARALAALDSVGLADRARHLPLELSGGQQQRAGIARALAREPKVLLADEPAGNLDTDTRDEIMSLLETLWREHGLTLVLVTHDSAIAGCAQRVATMNGGYLSVALAPEDR
jgi:putative ABC transport system ATP-binding protein